MMFILDNNVISELWKSAPDPKVLDWLLKNEWFVPAPVIAEIQAGAEQAPSETRRHDLNSKLDQLVSQFSAALLDWDAETARTWGKLQHSTEVRRQPQALWDSLIDAMGVRNNAMIVTRNHADFRHAATFDPCTGLEHAPGQHPA